MSNERLLFVEFQRRHQSMQPDNLLIAGPPESMIDVKQHLFSVFLQHASEYYDPNKDTDFAKAGDIIGMGAGLRMPGKPNGISLETARFLSSTASDQVVVYDGESGVVMKPNTVRKSDKPWFVCDYFPLDQQQVTELSIEKPSRLVLAAAKLVLFKSGYPQSVTKTVGIPGENGKFLPLYEVKDGQATELK